MLNQVIVDIVAATICFAGQCDPIIIGKDTHVGTYQMVHRRVIQPGYGGDILVYDETPTLLYAIHRVWRGREHLFNKPAKYRVRVSNGCINVKPETYERLLKYRQYQLIIK